MAPRKPILYLIDTSVLIYRLAVSLAGKYGEETVPTLEQCWEIRKITRLFVDSLPAISPIEVDDSIVWLGDGNSYFRSELCPTYKVGRRPKPNCYQIIRDELFDYAGVVAVNQFEADDLIAYVVRKSTSGQRLTILTIDSDLLQLTTECGRVRWLEVNNHSKPRLRYSLESAAEWLEKKTRKGRPPYTEFNSLREWVLADRYQFGDQSDGYPPESPAELYDLFQSPIHNLDALADRIEASTYMVDKLSVKTGRTARNRLEAALIALPFVDYYGGDRLGWRD